MSSSARPSGPEGMRDRDRVRDRVRALLGREGVEGRKGADFGDREAVDVEGVDVGAGGPGEKRVDPGSADAPPVALPSTAEEVAALFRTVREEGWRVRPAGAGVGLDLLPGAGARIGSASEPDLLVSTRDLAGIVEYEPADLTLRAGAGTTLEALQDVVRAERQWLPLDPPGGGRITLGGLVAMGTAGPLAAAFGRPRDQLLGVGLVDGRGQVLSLGGRVVKNVAGFDLVRLATGSRGALGLVHEVSLRLFPLPAEERTLLWSTGSREAGIALGRRLAELPFPFTSLEFLDGPPTGVSEEGGPRVLLRLADAAPAVERMDSEACRVAGSPAVRLEGAASARAARARSEREGASRPCLRLQALPEAVTSLLQALDAALPPARGGRSTEAHLTTGTVRVHGGDAPGEVLHAVEPLARAAASIGGTVRVIGLTREELRRADGHRIAPASSPRIARLHRELRRAFDPAGILPGSWREGWR